MTLGIDYSKTSGEFAAKRQKWANISASNTTTATNNSNTNGVTDTFTSSNVKLLGENKCTDGADDGKISVLSAGANIVEGVGKGAVNMVKSAIQHPFKTAAMIGVCCIPVVGPAVAAGLSAYGLYSGGKQILNAIDTANSATTDAEAKAAFENIGEGTLTTGLSAVGLKGSVGVLKGQLNGTIASDTVTAVKGELANSNHTAGSVVKTAVTEGAKETIANAKGVVDAVKTQGENTIAKAKEVKNNLSESVKQNGIKQTVSDTAKTTAKKVSDTAGKTVETAKQKISDLKSKYTKSGIDKSINKTINDAIDEYGTDSVKVADDGSFTVTRTNGTKVYYNKKGVKTKLEYKDGSVSEYSSNTIKHTSKVNNSTDPNATVTETVDTKTLNVRSKTYNSKDATSVLEFDDNGCIISEHTTLKDGVTNVSLKNGTYNAEGNFTGVETTASGKQIWYENGQEISNPSLIQKARINAKSTSAGVKLDKFISDDLTIGKYTIDNGYATLLGIAASTQDDE